MMPGAGLGIGAGVKMHLFGACLGNYALIALLLERQDDQHGGRVDGVV